MQVLYKIFFILKTVNKEQFIDSIKYFDADRAILKQVRSY